MLRVNVDAQISTVKGVVPCSLCHGRGKLSTPCSTCQDLSSFSLIHECERALFDCLKCKGSGEIIAEVNLIEVTSAKIEPKSIKPKAADFVIKALLSEIRYLQNMLNFDSPFVVRLPSDLSPDALTSIENFCKIPGVKGEVDSVGYLSLELEEE